MGDQESSAANPASGRDSAYPHLVASDRQGHFTAAPRRFELIGGFESTYQPGFDVDVAETSGHTAQRTSDLALLRAAGVSRLRYPIRWHRIEGRPGVFDWSDTDAVFAILSDGWRPIVDLVHHTSYPRWLTGGFADPRFPRAYLRYVEAFARRYPFVTEYTLFNEPLSTLFLCGHEGLWPPYRRGMESFVEMLRNVLPAIGQASRLCRELFPKGRHVHIDACERHTGSGAFGEGYAAYANDRRFFVLDALLGVVDTADQRPFVNHVLQAGGGDLLSLEPAPVDVVGLDYYAHCQWHFGPNGGRAPSPSPPPLADVIGEYWRRYSRPCMVSETNIRGYASDRASWLRYVLEQCEHAVAAGVELEGLCWFPFVDSCDWGSLLYRFERAIDPVGVYVVDETLRRRTSSMSVAYELAAHGAPAASLPAYRFEQPVAGWLAGFLPHMAGWPWQPAPAHEVPMAGSEYVPFEPLTVPDRTT